ncbi:hypothetical protein AQJ54_37720 [Streptomyces griseorubiginosus]|uniref:Uncharacterized protein n=1 Tax=Streptomyces griseorubiginosus TaxID=67304 RepID=A0A101RR53_9ACTN|nr:hypothetical protein AQJ54_37720 [Streptomyces griseorubiginosus]
MTGSGNVTNRSRTAANPSGTAEYAFGNAEDPVVVRRQGPGSAAYAAELLLDEVPVLDDFESEEDEEADDEESDELEELDVDDFEDDAGELLDEEPRLSLR